MDVTVCAGCGANLSAAGAVEFVERYEALVDPGEAPTLTADAFTIDGSAACTRCGAAVEYYDVRFDSGIGVGRRHVTDFDHRDAADGAVPVWCSCGWLSIVADAATAQKVAREHGSDPPRFEVRLLDVRHDVPDLRPKAWLASHASPEALVEVAQEAALGLWNDPGTGVCVWDSVGGCVVWADGAWTH